VRAGRVPRARRFEPVGARLRPLVRRRRRAVRQQHVALPPAGGTGPLGVAGLRPPRVDRWRAVPEDRRTSLPADPARARLLLVLDHPCGGSWMSLDEELPELLPEWLPKQRWFAAKG